MAKDNKKSIVGNSFRNSKRYDRKEAEEKTKEITTEETAEQNKPTVGRPKSEHGFKSFTTLLDPKKKAALAFIASIEGKKLFEVLDDALTQHLEKYKDQYPNIIP